MRIAGFPHPVVVDLEGLSVDRQDIPVRLDHNPRQGVGHTQRVAIENGQVIAEGLVMGAFTDIPRQIGMGAAEAIADAVWGLLLSNPVQADTKTFFHADHKNYAAGADTALTVDGLTAAEVLFGEQTRPNGRPLGVPASILLVPTALKVVAELLMKSVQLNETTTANKGKPSMNPHTGKFEVVSSTYLSNATFAQHKKAFARATMRARPRPDGHSSSARGRRSIRHGVGSLTTLVSSLHRITDPSRFGSP